MDKKRLTQNERLILQIKKIALQETVIELQAKINKIEKDLTDEQL